MILYSQKHTRHDTLTAHQCELLTGLSHFFSFIVRQTHRQMTVSLIPCNSCSSSAALVFSPIQFGVVLPLSLLFIPQLQALEGLDVVHILESLPVVLYYVSCERFHILLGAMGGGRKRSVDTQEERKLMTKVRSW